MGSTCSKVRVSNSIWRALFRRNNRIVWPSFTQANCRQRTAAVGNKMGRWLAERQMEPKKKKRGIFPWNLLPSRYNTLSLSVRPAKQVDNMSQQYPPHQTGRGGRGAGPGGRGAAAGGGPPGQPFQYQGRGGGGAPRPMGAWQPMEPPVQQAPAGYNPQQAQQQQLQPGQQQLQRGPPPQQGYGPPQGYYNPYAAQQQQQQQQQQAYPRGSWQPAGYAPSNMRGGVFYPPPGGAPPTAAGAAAGGAAPQVQSAAAPQAAAAAPTVQPPAPRVKKPLVITVRWYSFVGLLHRLLSRRSIPRWCWSTILSLRGHSRILFVSCIYVYVHLCI